MRTVIALASLCVALAACSEKPQTLNAKKVDTPAFQGAADPYVVGGWKVGDATSWDKQLTSRAQSQNEYVRIGAQ